MWRSSYSAAGRRRQECRRYWYEWIVCLALLLPTFCCLLLAIPAHASSDYLEVTLDRGSGALKAPQPEYSGTRLMVARGRDAKPWLRRKLHWDPDGEWSYRVEPYASYIDSPASNIELGLGFGLKVAVPLGQERVMGYVHGATGPFYTSQHTIEQSTQFNFASYAGAGLEYRFAADRALTVERYVRHFSNASIKNPNDGVDTRGWMVGWVVYR